MARPLKTPFDTIAERVAMLLSVAGVECIKLLRILDRE